MIGRVRRVGMLRLSELTARHPLDGHWTTEEAQGNESPPEEEHAIVVVGRGVVVVVAVAVAVDFPVGLTPPYL